MAGFPSSVLVDADWAQAHLNARNVRFVEVDVDTAAYDQSHIPGAVGWNWTSQLSTPSQPDFSSIRTGFIGTAASSSSLAFQNASKSAGGGIAGSMRPARRSRWGAR